MAGDATQASRFRGFLPNFRGNSDSSNKGTQQASLFGLRRNTPPPEQQQKQPEQTQLYKGPLVRIRGDAELKALVDEAILKTEQRYLDVDQYTPWQMMHGLLALRGDYKLIKNGKLISAVDYISDKAMYRGEYYFEKTPNGGRSHPFSVPYAFEGHINQFPALMSMTGLPLDHQFKVQNGTITVADIVKNAQMTANTNEEISWTLWFLTQYIDQDTSWTNQSGQQWSMAGLVRLQNQDSVVNAPCGGSHGLYAIAFARNAYVKQHGRLGGVWLESDFKLRNHIELARQLQNGDGSFSSNWLKGRGFTNDFQERIQYSGHSLEWLMMALPQSRLKEDWVRRGVQSVAQDLIHNATQPAECGPMYHALHSLVLYRERAYPESQAPKVEPPKVETPKVETPEVKMPEVQTPEPMPVTPEVVQPMTVPMPVVEQPAPVAPEVPMPTVDMEKPSATSEGDESAIDTPDDEPVVAPSENPFASMVPAHKLPTPVLSESPLPALAKPEAMTSSDTPKSKVQNDRPLLFLVNPESVDTPMDDSDSPIRIGKSAQAIEPIEDDDRPILPTLVADPVAPAPRSANTEEDFPLPMTK